MLELHIILIFMIIGSVVALEVDELLSSVIAVGTVGLGLCFAFLILKAPDVALTQLVVEILSVIILIRATLRKALFRVPMNGWVLHATTGIAFGVVLLVVALQCLPDLPKFGEPSLRIAQYFIKQGLEDTGAANLVAAVILDFRAYDTLGEVTVLFTAVVGVLAVVRTKGRKKPDPSGEQSDA